MQPVAVCCSPLHSLAHVIAQEPHNRSCAIVQEPHNRSCVYIHMYVYIHNIQAAKAGTATQQPQPSQARAAPTTPVRLYAHDIAVRSCICPCTHRINWQSVHASSRAHIGSHATMWCIVHNTYTPRPVVAVRTVVVVVGESVEGRRRRGNVRAAPVRQQPIDPARIRRQHPGPLHLSCAGLRSRSRIWSHHSSSLRRRGRGRNYSPSVLSAACTHEGY